MSGNWHTARARAVAGWNANVWWWWEGSQASASAPTRDGCMINHRHRGSLHDYAHAHAHTHKHPASPCTAGASSTWACASTTARRTGRCCRARRASALTSQRRRRWRQRRRSSQPRWRRPRREARPAGPPRRPPLLRLQRVWGIRCPAGPGVEASPPRLPLLQQLGCHGRRPRPRLQPLPRCRRPPLLLLLLQQRGSPWRVWSWAAARSSASAASRAARLWTCGSGTRTR